MLAVIVLAAGKSRRMGMPQSKVVLNLAGQPVIDYIDAACKGLNPDQIIYVVSPELKDHSAFHNKEIVIQEQPLGTGHAVHMAIPHLKASITHVMVVCGDTPLIETANLRTLLEATADLTVLAMTPPEGNTSAYGRIVMDGTTLTDIVEHKDATPAQQQLPLVNTGCFLFTKSFLATSLPRLQNNNQAGEYYLTDLVKIGAKDNTLMHVAQTEFAPMQGFNTPHEFADITNALQNRWRERFLAAGVLLHKPDSITFSFDTVIEPLAEVGPFVNIGNNCIIEKRAKILSFCHLEHAVVKHDATVGPFAHLRGHAIIDHNAAIGNFVEVKGSHIKPHAKAKHLCYLGDASVGERSNIGAGTITCNYDGYKKHKTHIGDGVMVGANSTLIAPITIGDNAYIAAGSTIHDNVENDCLAIAREKQINKHNGATKLRDLKRSS